MIAGHKKQWQFLKSLKESDRIPHAFLFSGESQIGKKKTAVEFAKFVFCQDSENPCNKCRSCIDIEENRHPDFILLKPDSKNIQISQIRDLVWKLSLKPYSSDCKIAVIDNAHLMDREAQNCFLKTLEEPKGNTSLILVTEYPEALLPTITSRTQRIKFFSVGKEEIKNYLVKSGVSRADYFSSLCSGKPGRAIDFLKSEEKIKEQKQIISDLEEINRCDLASRFKYAKSLLEKQDSNLREVLDVWVNYFRNLLILKLKENPFDRKSVLKIKNIISSIQKASYLSSTTNVNPKLTLEILLMEI
jgi:DNA polymerase III subunit delta'